jgi:hypothetical protein
LTKSAALLQYKYKSKIMIDKQAKYHITTS